MISWIVSNIYSVLVWVMTGLLAVCATGVFVSQLFYAISHPESGKTTKTFVLIAAWYVTLLAIVLAVNRCALLILSDYGWWSYLFTIGSFVAAGFLMWRFCDYAEAYVTHLDYRCAAGKKPLLSH